MLSKTVLFSIILKLVFVNANHTQSRNYAFILSALFQDHRRTQDVRMLVTKRIVLRYLQQKLPIIQCERKGRYGTVKNSIFIIFVHGPCKVWGVFELLPSKGNSVSCWLVFRRQQFNLYPRIPRHVPILLHCNDKSWQYSQTHTHTHHWRCPQYLWIQLIYF